MLRGGSLADTGIHGYGYYDTRTRLVNIRVSKIPVSADNEYPFLISIFYSLRVRIFLTSLHMIDLKYILKLTLILVEKLYFVFHFMP